MKRWQLKLCAYGPIVVFILGTGAFLWWATYRWWVGVGFVVLVSTILCLINLSVWAGVKLEMDAYNEKIRNIK